MGLDTDLLVRVGRLRRPLLDRSLAGFCTLGNHGHGWVGLAALVALVRADAAILLAAAAAVWGTLALNSAVKHVVRRPRPPAAGIAATLVRVPTSHSFPSAHASTSAAGALTLGGLVPGLLPLLVPVAVLMAASRVYLAVHYPSDVVVGLLLGTATGLAAVALA